MQLLAITAILLLLGGSLVFARGMVIHDHNNRGNWTLLERFLAHPLTLFVSGLVTVGCFTLSLILPHL